MDKHELVKEQTIMESAKTRTQSLPRWQVYSDGCTYHGTYPTFEQAANHGLAIVRGSMVTPRVELRPHKDDERNFMRYAVAIQMARAAPVNPKPTELIGAARAALDLLSAVTAGDDPYDLTTASVIAGRLRNALEDFTTGDPS